MVLVVVSLLGKGRMKQSLVAAEYQNPFRFQLSPRHKAGTTSTAAHVLGIGSKFNSANMTINQLQRKAH
jgi:hypothetical protein